MILARWTYTKEEWSTFLRSAQKRKNIFSSIVRYLLSKTIRIAPVVRITPESVWIGNDSHHFQTGKYQLRQTELRGEGALNILAITYERKGNSQVIRIPVPKGKLREAIEVQEKLNANW